jgi:hypothetical protein
MKSKDQLLEANNALAKAEKALHETREQHRENLRVSLEAGKLELDVQIIRDRIAILAASF